MTNYLTQRTLSSLLIYKNNSFVQNEASILNQSRRRRMNNVAADSSSVTSSLPSFLQQDRRLDQQESCDSAFLSCLPDLNCVDCFATLELEGIDWTGVTPATTCQDVVKFLLKGGHCKRLENQKESTDIFCNTFSSCVVWENTDDDESVDDYAFDDDDWVNCTALTECKWEGMKENWIGDGVCHDNVHGCYNTAVCKFDGGDCCWDTCVDGDSEFKECGHDGYACRDPSSKKCDSSLTLKCPKSDEDKPKPVSCKDGESKFKLKMYDSFGDGWDATTLTLKKKGKKSKTIFEGQLSDGNEGTEYVCLSKDAECYTVETKGGTWGVEVSWEIKPMKDGAPTSEYNKECCFTKEE